MARPVRRNKMPDLTIEFNCIRKLYTSKSDLNSNPFKVILLNEMEANSSETLKQTTSLLTFSRNSITVSTSKRQGCGIISVL